MGPIKAAFVGTAKMDLKDAEKSGHVIGRGRDSLSRSQLDGMLDFHVTRSETGDTVLSLDMTYKLTGTLSQFSRPTLVAEIADRILVQVASAIEARAQGKEPDATAQTSLNGLSLLASVFKGWWVVQKSLVVSLTSIHSFEGEIYNNDISIGSKNATQ